MLIGQYNEIVNATASFDDICEPGIIKYIESFYDQLSGFISDFSKCITLPIEALNSVVDEDVATVMRAMQEVLNMLEPIEKHLKNLTCLEELEDKLGKVTGMMALLLPNILNGAKHTDGAFI